MSAAAVKDIAKAVVSIEHKAAALARKVQNSLNAEAASADLSNRAGVARSDAAGAIETPRPWLRTVGSIVEIAAYSWAKKGDIIDHRPFASDYQLRHGSVQEQSRGRQDQ